VALAREGFGGCALKECSKDGRYRMKGNPSSGSANPSSDSAKSFERQR
jgi:hypothetical protein